MEGAKERENWREDRNVQRMKKKMEDEKVGKWSHPTERKTNL